MKKLCTLVMLILLLSTLGSCRRNKTIQYVRFVPDSAAQAADDIPKDEDIDGYIDDDEAIFVVPDIPEEREVDMQATSYELERMMMGKE